MFNPDNSAPIDHLEVPDHIHPEDYSSDETAILDRLLRMADSYRASQAVHQAISMYFEIANNYPGSLAALQARERLLDIGDNYQRHGEHRQARSIYQQLL